jgi:DNA repair exonuclease SbcCD ATPase subunit
VEGAGWEGGQEADVEGCAYSKSLLFIDEGGTDDGRDPQELLLKEKDALTTQRDELLSRISSLEADHEALTSDLTTLRSAASTSNGVSSKEVLSLTTQLEKLRSALSRSEGSAEADLLIFSDKEATWRASLEAAKERLIEHEGNVEEMRKEVGREKRAREEREREREREREKREEQLKREVGRLKEREKALEREKEELEAKVRKAETGGGA